MHYCTLLRNCTSSPCLAQTRSEMICFHVFAPFMHFLSRIVYNPLL